MLDQIKRKLASLWGRLMGHDDDRLQRTKGSAR